MCHSIIISEPVAHVLGLIVGLATFGIATLFTPDRDAQLWAGMVGSVLCNVVVGAKVNILLLDLLALIIVRPLSAVAAGPILAALANALVK